MNVEVSASVCCSCDAVRMSVEKGVPAGSVVSGALSVSDVSDAFMGPPEPMRKGESPL